MVLTWKGHQKGTNLIPDFTVGETEVHSGLCQNPQALPAGEAFAPLGALPELPRHLAGLSAPVAMEDGTRAPWGQGLV